MKLYLVVIDTKKLIYPKYNNAKTSRSNSLFVQEFFLNLLIVSKEE